MKCPWCGSERFYLKDPDDEYEIYEFETGGGNVEFDCADNEGEPPPLGDDSEAWCSKCKWHDKFRRLREC